MAKATKSHITQKRLKELLDYDPATGIFRWKVNRAAKHPGDIAGCIKVDSGYVIIGLDMRLYRAHQLAWLWMIGRWPRQFMDHRDTNKSNNRWKNLRLATKSQNMANMSAPIHNTSGLKGVSRYRQGDKWGKSWQAGIQINGCSKHLGHFTTMKEAHAAYIVAAKKFFGEFARAK